MLPNDNTILLNERYVLDARWSDQRRALTTLVHELVHIQRGAYISGSSAELESATSIATVEVLSNSDRIAVLLDLMGRATRIEIARQNLEIATV